VSTSTNSCVTHRPKLVEGVEHKGIFQLYKMNRLTERADMPQVTD